jgi:anaerobic selenocysteine-containing dehydrogenase
MKNITDAIKMTCPFCASRCGMVLGMQEGRLVNVQGDPDNPVSRGWTCSTGRASIVHQYKSLLNT